MGPLAVLGFAGTNLNIAPPSALAGVPGRSSSPAYTTPSGVMPIPSQAIFGNAVRFTIDVEGSPFSSMMAPSARSVMVWFVTFSGLMISYAPPSEASSVARIVCHGVRRMPSQAIVPRRMVSTEPSDSLMRCTAGLSFFTSPPGRKVPRSSRPPSMQKIRCVGLSSDGQKANMSATFAGIPSHVLGLQTFGE